MKCLSELRKIGHPPPPLVLGRCITAQTRHDLLNLADSMLTGHPLFAVGGGRGQPLFARGWRV